ncbi:MAG: glycosyltransferase [Moorea sp. SIO3I7]|uniref:glycosyltransferase family 4 protein n=2 Tax=Moorena TaxID=1155738 RepID=UPI0013BEDCB3|nr:MULTISPECIES: glycosyltransferase family 4 protein [unclassified Moorena]NEN94438.1 glycosyltransferase [Moorena sp. SIO3I7]NEO04439.1 glycosyltransferase [Moorena sp. SIO3I8]NEO22732.1 glycosyltransferase [Moorena sp. SIO4A5]NEQ58134.1 glycosyltransferase [Moorena sp. SIO4A1]
MTILHINQTDKIGGAAIAAYRIHQGLLRNEIDSRFLVDSAITNSSRVAKVPPRGKIDDQLRKLTTAFGLNNIYITNSAEICQHPFYENADVLHFHNLHTGYLNYLALPSITRNKPAVLTLHDMWSFTGHCAYSFDCKRWQSGCGSCPYLDTDPAITRDATAIEWKLKQWSYRRSNLAAIIATSQWNAAQAKQSILSHIPVHYIPLGVDIEAYQPFDTKQCRSLLGLPTNKKVLMFGAQNLTNSRKGGDLLLKALSSLPQSLKGEIVLLTLGDGGEVISESVGIQTQNLGFVSSDHLKAIAYSAADLFLFPTRADAFGLVALEAMACGTPTVSFKVGGVPDLVRPGTTGYLAEPENVEDFCNGIIQLLTDHNLREYMSQQCRKVAVAEYSSKLQTERHINLYRSILEESKDRLSKPTS